MSATSVRLWFVRETAAARLYSRVPLRPPLAPDVADQVWIPRSIVEHTSKDGDQHTVTLPDWFIRKESL